jgi:magnesium transporter
VAPADQRGPDVGYPVGGIADGHVDGQVLLDGPAVSIAVLAACSVATLVAMALPWLMARTGKDPAFGSGPLATVVQDLLSLLIYFSVAVTLVK